MEPFMIMVFLLVARTIIFMLFIVTPALFLVMCVKLLIDGDAAGLLGIFAAVYLFWAVQKRVRMVMTFFREEKDFLRFYFGPSRSGATEAKIENGPDMMTSFNVADAAECDIADCHHIGARDCAVQSGYPVTQADLGVYFDGDDTHGQT